MLVWRGGSLRDVGGLTAIEDETVGEEVKANEECEYFGGYLWTFFCGECELRAVCSEGFEGMGVGCEDKVTH